MGVLQAQLFTPLSPKINMLIDWDVSAQLIEASMESHQVELPLKILSSPAAPHFLKFLARHGTPLSIYLTIWGNYKL